MTDIWRHAASALLVGMALTASVPAATSTASAREAQAPARAELRCKGPGDLVLVVTHPKENRVRGEIRARGVRSGSSWDWSISFEGDDGGKGVGSQATAGKRGRWSAFAVARDEEPLTIEAVASNASGRRCVGKVTDD
ncbi:hypothetical protein [Nocardioides ferulae]|uniref:hypothetical protein n=1 Tax=Nocardioides ferulae TaxID=2340821 RepID=UPI000EAF58D8|nr:hypothetical protein [Nocardioides ferulae]